MLYSKSKPCINLSNGRYYGMWLDEAQEMQIT